MPTRAAGGHTDVIEAQPSQTIIKRDGRAVSFDSERIYRAIEKAFKAELGQGTSEHLDEVTRARVGEITETVVQEALQRAAAGERIEVESIQDAVERHLMKHGDYAVARRYIVYREDRKKARALRGDTTLQGMPQAELFVQLPDGTRERLSSQRIRRTLDQASRGSESMVALDEMAGEVIQTLYDGISPTEIAKATIFAAKARIERDPAYSHVAARLLLNVIYNEVLPNEIEVGSVESLHRNHFKHYIAEGVTLDRLSPSLAEYDLERIADALDLERDLQFTYMGLQTLYDRYLIHNKGRRIETPQYFWMRVAMGLALNEGAQREERAIEFYEVLSKFLFTSSTPTLFNAGTLHPQLSSCYLSTIEDDLEHIFKVIGDDARLSKWAGGLGNDWTNVRATGGYIKGTNGTSQGVIPFLKVANDTAVAVNQGGKRKGAMCAYIETWHLDIEDFLELRKNTGDERRRTHDMHTANWIPDLFMKRVAEESHWTLFNPAETPDLHHLYGKAFDARYLEYEAMAQRGELKQYKRVEAQSLWRKMLSMLFETGHPWITFKDPSNIRSPQDHAGVVHCSNLCTEILLNTSREETAVCNLGSINLGAHTTNAGLDEELLASTVRTAVRMLDNVIDINYYPTPEARNANLRHRPIGLGIMGFQDALYMQDFSYASEEAVEFADSSMEMISYYAILASTELAAERGHYPSYPGSKWSRGLLPIDTLAMLQDERGGDVDMDRTTRMDWNVVRAAVLARGMRNSNTMAIAPTATISNITGVTQSIEPMYKHLFAKSNLSGEFTWVNTYLVNDLKALGLWDAEMVEDLKYYDGTLTEIERIPEEIRAKYMTAFEIDPQWIIECGSRRQKWIDMGQSLNLYLGTPSGKKLNEMYFLAWRKGLKTTYYLRTLGATQVEKSTVDINRRGIQPRWMKSKSASSNVQVERGEVTAPKACSIADPDCEACQ
ncbi:MAG: ribonucleoside-diphosphate reductase subunit alpha [Candidatus Hydrogenedentes bacterium]|nr:ribonucleoside-diphosphate reductase subunit alpha [Candidatus Hydrogenedentota bacterium]